MLRALGGKLSKMAAKEEDLRLTANLKSFKGVSKLGKVKLKQICKNLDVDIEKCFGKKNSCQCCLQCVGYLNIKHCTKDGLEIGSSWRDAGYLFFEDIFD